MSPTPSSGAGQLFTVVIASRCDDERSALLARACESVRSMAGGHPYSILVVANGSRVSPRVLGWLADQRDVRVIRLRSGSYPLARRVGAEMAESEFVAFLDDDDELVADTLGRKIAHFGEHPEVDMLVTDGFRVTGSKESRIFPPPDQRRDDLVETMMNAGWGAGAITLRMRNVDLSALDAEFRHMEWTLATLQLASRLKVGFLDEPTYRYFDNTPGSLSKSPEHNLAVPEVWRRLGLTYAGTRYEPLVRSRYGRECHNVAVECAWRGRVREAWRFHLRSLACPNGLARLPFAVKLIVASLSGRAIGRPALEPAGEDAARSGTMPRPGELTDSGPEN